MLIRFIITIAVLNAFLAHAGPETIIKQRAKDTANQNNARQGVAPPPNAPPPPKPGTAPAAARPLPPDPAAKVRADLAAIVATDKIKPEQKQTLSADLLALARGSNKPSGPALGKFSNALADALAGKTFEPPAQAKLVQNLNLLLNSASLSTSRTDEVTGEVRSLLTAAGLNATVTDPLLADLTIVVAEVQAPQ